MSGEVLFSKGSEVDVGGEESLRHKLRRVLLGINWNDSNSTTRKDENRVR